MFRALLSVLSLSLAISGPTYYVESDFSGLGYAGSSSAAQLSLSSWGYEGVYSSPTDGLSDIKASLCSITTLLGIQSHLIERAQRLACALKAALPYECAYGLTCGHSSSPYCAATFGGDAFGGYGGGLAGLGGYGLSSSLSMDSFINTGSYAFQNSYRARQLDNITAGWGSQRRLALSAAPEFAGKIYAYDRVGRGTDLGHRVKALEAALARTIKCIDEVTMLLEKATHKLHSEPVMSAYSMHTFSATIEAENAGAWYSASEFDSVDYASVGLGALEARVDRVLRLLSIMTKQVCEAKETAAIATTILFALRDALHKSVVYLPSYGVGANPYASLSSPFGATAPYYYTPPLGSPGYNPGSYGGMYAGELFGGAGRSVSDACPPGYYCLSGNSPVLCPAGFFCPANSITPQPCITGTVRCALWPSTSKRDQT